MNWEFTFLSCFSVCQSLLARCLCSFAQHQGLCQLDRLAQLCVLLCSLLFGPLHLVRIQPCRFVPLFNLSAGIGNVMGRQIHESISIADLVLQKICDQMQVTEVKSCFLKQGLKFYVHEIWSKDILCEKCRKQRLSQKTYLCGGSISQSNFLLPTSAPCHYHPLLDLLSSSYLISNCPHLLQVNPARIKSSICFSFLLCALRMRMAMHCRVIALLAAS